MAGGPAPLLRIALDARFACARYDGVGRYVASLLRELVALPDGPACVAVWPEEEGGRRYPLPAPGERLTVLRPVHARAPESPHSQWELPRLVRGRGVGLWHSPFPFAPVAMPLPVVTTLADCIPERFPGYFGGRHLLYRGAVWASLRRSRLVVVPSEMSGADAVRFYRVPSRRVRVVPQGVDTAPPPDASVERVLRAGLGLDSGYLLVVGRPRPHKGYRVLVEALARIASSKRPQLVRVGTPDPRLPDGHEEAARELGVELRPLQGLSEAELLAVYRGAALVAVPSLVEGFGLPLLEALAAGAPVLASDIQPLRATGGEVVRYAAAGEVRSWERALDDCLADNAWRRAAGDQGPERAAEFSWTATARGHAAVYREVLS